MKVISKKDSKNFNIGTIGNLEIKYYTEYVYPKYEVTYPYIKDSSLTDFTRYTKGMFKMYWMTEKELRLKKLKKLNRVRPR